MNVIPRTIQLIAGRTGGEYHHKWIKEILKKGTKQCNAKWTQNVAVGDKEFVMDTVFRRQDLHRFFLTPETSYETSEEWIRFYFF